MFLKKLLDVILVLHANSGYAEKYIDRSNPNFELCKEFKLYIERHADKPLYCGLVEDSEFKDFRLPKFKEAPAGLGMKLSMQFSANDNISPRKTLEEWREELLQLKNDVSTSEYKTVTIDLDHDGRQDQVLMHFRKKICATQKVLDASLFVYGENELLRQDFKGLSGYQIIKGLPFFIGACLCYVGESRPLPYK